MKRSRYNVKKIMADGIRFDSKKELARYRELLLLQVAGEIEDLQVHPRYPIVIGGIEVRHRPSRAGKLGRVVTYVADFSYLCVSRYGGHRVVEDCKMESGHLTEVYKLKRALMSAMGIEITET